MTSTQFQQLAQQVIENDPQKAGPLVKLLHGFRGLNGDPAGEIIMDEVIGSLYLKTTHCEESLKEFVSIAA